MINKNLSIICALATISYAANAQDLIRVIKAGSHTQLENEMHKNLCLQDNAIDVTDLSDIELIGNATDAVICWSTNSQLASSSSPAKQLMASSLTTEAPNGVFRFGAYSIKGVANYTGGTIGSGLAMTAGVDEDHCAVTGGANIPVSNGAGSIYTTCSYPASHTGTRQSYMKAVLEGMNSISYGKISLCVNCPFY